VNRPDRQVLRVVAVQNMEGGEFGRVERHLRAAGHDLHVVHAYRGEALPPLREVDAVFVGGSPLAAYDYHQHPFLREEAAFLARAVAADVPCFGICFGAQLLAHLLGGRAVRAPHQEIGAGTVRLTETGRSDPLFAGFPPAFPVFQWHGDTFDLPPDAELLAVGDGIRHQVYRCARVVGVQFHPEVTPSQVARWADANGPDLAEVGKTPAQVVAEARAIDAEMDRTVTRLLDNFCVTVVVGRR
jgi:GMP synthase-like glutamine amidotransferase